MPFEAVAGQRYFIRISAVRHTMGNFAFFLDHAAPVNDNFSSALSLNNYYTDPASHVVSTVYATAETGENDHGGQAPTHSVWYVSSPAQGGEPYTVNTSGSDFDTAISVYGVGYPYGYSETGGPVELVANDNQAAEEGILTSSADWEGAAHHLYRIGVTGANGQSGTLRINFGRTYQMVPRIRTVLLPYARAGRVGEPVTAFVSFLNNGYATARRCGIALDNPDLPIDLAFRPTDPVTNALAGDPGQTQPAEVLRPVTFLVSLTPREAFPPQDIALVYRCDSGETTAPVTAGVNTFLMSAETFAPADILAIAATVTNTGIVDVPVGSGAGFLSTAALNIGAGDIITFTADTGQAELPLDISVCETSLTSGGACLAPRSASVTVDMHDEVPRTFAIFVRASGDVAFNPSEHRIFARWLDSQGVIRGATSVAVRTQ